MAKRATLGLHEEVTLFSDEGKKKVKARVDTGATKSSIDVTLAAELKLGPITGKKTVKSAHGTTLRPIIRVHFKIDGKELDAGFTLAERAHMTYPVLIGQDVLKKGEFLIDPLLR
jgi:hypothetical protein